MREPTSDLKTLNPKPSKTDIPQKSHMPHSKPSGPKQHYTFKSMSGSGVSISQNDETGIFQRRLPILQEAPKVGPKPMKPLANPKGEPQTQKA